MLPSDASSAAPTRKFEYGAYARSIAANARSRRTTKTRSSAGDSAPGRWSTDILARDQLREEGRSLSPEVDAEPLADRRAEIREGLATAKRRRTNSGADCQQAARTRVRGRSTESSDRCRGRQL